MDKVELSFQTLLGRAKKGAEWLDETQPGWRMKIKLDHLTVKQADSCVIGQLHGGNYGKAAPIGARDMGFTLSVGGENTSENWETLQAAWEQVLR